MTEKEKDISIHFTFTLEEFEFLRECFLVLDESFEINTTIEQSCIAILLKMKKRRHKRFEKFVYKMSKKLMEFEEEAKGKKNEELYD